MGKLPSERVKIWKKNQAGQALLIVLLILSVVLTVALSVVSRSVTEVTITEYEENSARALSAAEAGVEETLMSGMASGGMVTLDNSATYTTTVTYADSATGEFVYPDGLKSGESVTFWLVSHADDGSLTCASGDCFMGDEMQVCWGDSTAPDSAVELSFYYDNLGTWAPPNYNFSNVKVKRLAYDSGGPRTPSNNFDVAGGSCVINGQDFEHSTPNINLVTLLSPDCDPSTSQGCLLMLRARLLYNQNIDQRIGIIASSAIPAQGAVIDSTGEFNDSTRRVQVFRSFPTAPDIFDSTVFSYGDITK